MLDALRPLHAFLSGTPFLGRTCLVAGFFVLFCIFRKIVVSVVQCLSSKRDIRKLGKWAILTGATDGIGKAMAIELCKLGMDLMLVARSIDKLKTVAAELKSISPRSDFECRVLVVDFSDNGDEVYKKMENEFKNLDVGLLINCVGVAYPYAMYFDETDPKLLDDLINVNLRSALRTTRIIYAGMRERRRGAIICVGSGASELPCEPLYAAYAAVKAGVESFCRNLQAECAMDNVLVQCHTPLLVATKLSKCKRPSLTVLSPEKYARCAVKQIQKGRTWRFPTVSPSCVHTIIINVANFIPANLWKAIRLPQVQSIRNRALKKKEKEG